MTTFEITAQVVFLIILELALALSLPAVPERTAIVVMTYMVVVFSIGIQGMTLGRLVTKIYPEVPGDAEGVRP